MTASAVSRTKRSIHSATWMADVVLRGDVAAETRGREMHFDIFLTIST